jgi:predicted MFS family arabinose efflux permease
MTAGTPTGRPPGNRLPRFTALVSTLDRFAMPPMILAIARDLDLPLADVARAVGGYFLAYGLMQPVWGMVGGRIGVVRMLRLTALLAALATAATALAGDAASLLAFRVLAGAAFGAAIPAALFYVGDTAAPGRRHREVTDLMAGVALGTAGGTLGGGVLAATAGWRFAFLITGAGALVLFVALRGLPELPPARAAAGGLAAPLLAVLRSPGARILLLLAAVEGAVLIGALTFLPAAAERAGSGPAVAAAVTAVFGVAVLVLAPVVGRLERRVRPAALIAAGASCAAVGCALAAVSVRPSLAVAVCVLLGAAWAAMHSTLQTWATQVAPDAGLAAVSLFAGALFAGSALATVIGGRVAGDGRFAPVFAAAAALAVPLGVAGTVARARWQRSQQTRWERAGETP